MPTTPEAIIADINEAATAGFRGRLIARGQARAIIWRDGVLPPGAQAFAPQVSHDLRSYAYCCIEPSGKLRPSCFVLGLRGMNVYGMPNWCAGP